MKPQEILIRVSKPWEIEHIIFWQGIREITKETTLQMTYWYWDLVETMNEYSFFYWGDLEIFDQLFWLGPTYLSSLTERT